MNNAIPDKLLQDLSDFISSNMALSFPKERWSDLERKMSMAAKDLSYSNVNDFVTYILSKRFTREHTELLASILTINETYFWREPDTFKALEQKIIPELVKSKTDSEKRIRIWSAGCSSGEEAYSIAIALSRVISDIEKWNISILATDIHPAILKKANKGIYKKWSFRNVPSWLKQKYFIERENNTYEIIPEIKKFVQFEYQNLAEDVFPSPLNNTNAMDIIFCRNVLMYFSPQLFKQIVNAFHKSLTENGHLIVSASELSYNQFSQFKSINYSGATIYTKSKLNGDSENTYDDFYKFDPIDLIDDQNEKFVPEEDFSFPLIEDEKTEEPAAVEVPLPKLSRFEEAEKLYAEGQYSIIIEKLNEKDLEINETFLLIRAFANKGELTKAIDLCKKALDIDGLNPQMQYLYASILIENLQENEALKALKKAIYIDQDFVLPYYTMGNIYARQGHISEAKKCYRNVISILNKYPQEEIVPESEGITAGRFKEIIQGTIQSKAI